MAGAMSNQQDTVAIRAISRDTIWEWGLDTGEIVRTPSWQDTLSVALPVREDFTSWTERIHPDDRTETIKRLQRAIEEGRQELQYSYRLLGPNGNVSLRLGSRFYRAGNRLETAASYRSQCRTSILLGSGIMTAAPSKTNCGDVF